MTFPSFPHFKPLALEDQSYFTRVADGYPPYSDFDFASLWSWHGAEKASWCQDGANLILLLADYTTSDPMLTLIGADDVNATADHALRFAEEHGYLPLLKLVPEVAASLLDPSRFFVRADPDHHDYVYFVADHLDFRGRRLKTHRAALNRFRRAFGGYEAVVLDPSDTSTQRELLLLWDRWEESAASPSQAEREAFCRFLSVANRFVCIATGVALNNSLVGFDITVLNANGWGNSLFGKADRRLNGVYSALQHEAAKRLLGGGCHYVNFEQDLGIPGLRSAKQGFGPCQYLRKFSVARGPGC